MASDTYSLAATGIRADATTAAKAVTLGDSAAQGINASINQWGGPQNNMRTGAQVLCKNRDGSQSWYTLDAERSTPSNPVLKAV